MNLTYKYRVKDGGAATRRNLRAQAHAVNFVWNYCCQTDREATSRYRAGMITRRPSAFDLIKLCTGVSRELGLHSDCVSAICQKFIDARNSCFPKTPRFRSYKRSLDWIPVTRLDKAAKFADGVLTFQKRRYYVWQSRSLPENGKAKSWSLSTDARGRWYLNITVELPEAEKREVKSEVGIDLGLKTLSTLSNGDKIEMPAFYRQAEEQLARLQRFGMKKRARALAAKVANQRRHFLHVQSTRLVREHDRIVVGDVSPSKLSKTRMAKSIHDAGWAMLRSMLQYKSIATGATVEIVSERHSSATCSACGARSGPKGIAGLRIREWVCEDCGVVHDRDVNASLNILLGAERRPPAVEIPGL